MKSVKVTQRRPVRRAATPASGETLDKRLIALLQVNARMPVVRLAQALGCARSTVQLRLKALEESGVITGYTVSLAKRMATGVNALVLIRVESQREPDVVQALTRRHEISKLYLVSGRYDVCAMVHVDTMDEIDQVISRVRALKGVTDTLTTMLMATKVDRPD